MAAAATFKRIHAALQNSNTINLGKFCRNLKGYNYAITFGDTEPAILCRSSFSFYVQELAQSKFYQFFFTEGKIIERGILLVHFN